MEKSEKVPYINDFLKSIRKKNGITQEKFATMIFKSLPTIKRYDTGSIIPEETLRRSCEVLGLNFFEVLKLQEENIFDDFGSWNEIEAHNRALVAGYQLPFDKLEEYGIISPPYDDLLFKYKNDLNKIDISKISNEMQENLKSYFDLNDENNTFKNNEIKNIYNIKSLENELINYLKFKDNFLNIETTKEKQNRKIEKIFSFIDFLYFQDIIKK